MTTSTVHSSMAPPRSLHRRREATPRSRTLNDRGLRWLVRLRWCSIATQALVILATSHLLQLELPLGWLSLLLGMQAATNTVVQLRQHRSRAVSTNIVAATLFLDTIWLTCVLLLTGGSYNPFTFVILVTIAIGALVLPSGWAWALTAFALLLQLSLFIDGLYPIHAIDHATHMEHMDLHMKGMWVAMACAAAFLVYFVRRVSSEFALAREMRQRAEQFAAVATLAAGAAHELATPLGTIAVAAKELERELEAHPSPSTVLANDARLIREQTARCREILDQMNEHMRTGAPTRHSVPDLLDAGIHSSQVPAELIEIEHRDGAEHGSLDVPRRPFVAAIASILDNAFEAVQAATDRRPVRITVRSEPETVTIEIEDHGVGMPKDILERAGEPFFTTKSHGLGLGLFSAQSLVRILHGQFSVQSVFGRGTRITMTLPSSTATHEQAT